MGGRSAEDAGGGACGAGVDVVFAVGLFAEGEGVCDFGLDEGVVVDAVTLAVDVVVGRAHLGGALPPVPTEDVLDQQVDVPGAVAPSGGEGEGVAAAGVESGHAVVAVVVAADVCGDDVEVAEVVHCLNVSGQA